MFREEIVDFQLLVSSYVIVIFFDNSCMLSFISYSFYRRIINYYETIM